MNAQITQETLELAKQALSQPLAKDASAAGYTTALGLTAYELEAPAKFLVPVLSPFRNSLPRVKAPVGSVAAHWKAITGINTTNVRASTALSYAGGQITTSTAEFLAAYKKISLGDTVPYDAQTLARGFQDLRATSGINLLYSLMIEEDILSLGGQAFALGTVQAPTVTVKATDKGSIAIASVDVKVKARTLQGYRDGQGTAVSTAGTCGSMTGSTNQIQATVPAVPMAVCYDWYVGATGGTLYYAGTTTVNTVVISSVPSTAATVSNGLQPTLAKCSIPGYYDTATPPVWHAIGTAAATGASTDYSADANAYNGLIATLGGYYLNGAFVTPGTSQATASGAYIKSLDGAKLTGDSGTISEIDTALAYLWDNANVSPTKILMNSADHISVSSKIIASGGAYTLFKPGDVAERQNVVGGQLVATYINKACNGQSIMLETQPHLPQGTIIGITETLPYPNNQVPNVMEIETQQEYQQIEYPPARLPGQANGGYRYDLEVGAMQTFKNYFPGSMFMLQNVGIG